MRFWRFTSTAAALCMMVVGASSAQESRWERLSRIPTGDAMADVDVLDDGKFVTIGLGGMLVFGEFTGGHWTQKIVPVTGFAATLAFSGNNGIIGGIECLQTTRDMGRTWRSPDTAFDAYASDALFLNDSTALICVGGRILRSTDAGQSWMPTGGSIEHVLRLAFATPMIGIGVGESGFVARTVDGGLSWTIVTIAEQSDAIESAAFVDASTGFAISEEMAVYRTSNGGETWDSVGALPLAGQGTFDRISLAFIDERVGVAAATSHVDYGYLALTTDGGATWADRSSMAPAGLLDVALNPNGTGVAVGTKGTIIATTDSGSTWVEISSGLRPDIIGVTAFDDDRIVLISGESSGERLVITTDNGGDNWTEHDVSGIGWIRDWSFFDPMHGMLVGDSLATTADGGETWSVRHIAGSSVVMTAPSRALLLSRDTIYETSDGGESWRLFSQLPSGDYDELRFTTAALGTVVSKYERILRTSDSGRSWDEVPFPSDNPAYAVAIDSATVVVLRFGEIWVTNDAGANWISSRPEIDGVPVAGGLRDVAFAGRRHGIVVGEFGTLAETTDGGVSWNIEPTGTTCGLYGVTMPAGGHAFVAGLSGTLLRSIEQISSAPAAHNSSSKSSLQIESAVTSDQSLRVRVTVATAGRLDLAVYTIDGRRVAELETGFAPAGTSTHDIPLGSSARGVLLIVARTGASLVALKQAMQ